ncbi:hypothetical protein S83_049883 [Arachis hypogaea]
MNSVGSGSSNLCINDTLSDDELRSILAKLESEKDKEIFGLVCNRWLRLQSTERKKLAARAGPHRLRRMADRFTRMLELDLAQFVLRSFYPGITDSDLDVIANGFTCLRVLNLHNCKVGEGCKGYCRSEYRVCLPVVAVPEEGACSSSYSYLFALDSSGAFLEHIPTAIFVWIGMKCDPIMERDARGAVGQIIRYEKAEGPVKVSRKAHEPANFWEVFSKFLPLMDKSYSKVESFKSSAKVQPDEHETHLPARESSWSALRRKVSSSHMKEIVTAPKSSLPRIYSDSMFCIHSTKTSSPFSSSISSSSPSYLSPDSVSSPSYISHWKEGEKRERLMGVRK